MASGTGNGMMTGMMALSAWVASGDPPAYLGRQLAGPLHQLVAGQHFRNQPPMFGLARAHVTTGPAQLHAHVVGNPPWQTLNCSGTREESPLHLRQPELGLLGCEHDVGGQRQLETAADGKAIDGADDRFVEVPILEDAGKSPG